MKQITLYEKISLCVDYARTRNLLLNSFVCLEQIRKKHGVWTMRNGKTLKVQLKAGHKKVNLVSGLALAANKKLDWN